MRIDVMDVVAAELSDAAWYLYRDAFEELRTAAVQRHLLSRGEFDDTMADVRLGKYVGTDAGADRLFALATMTNELDSLPLISPDYFQQRWPTHFAEGRIFYIGFVAVHPDYRGAGAFEMLVTALYGTVAACNGVAVLDVCRRNEQLFKLPQAIHRLLETLSGMVRSSRIDTQSYWSFEFPSR